MIVFRLHARLSQTKVEKTKRMFPQGPVPKHLFKEHSILRGLQR